MKVKTIKQAHNIQRLLYFPNLPILTNNLFEVTSNFLMSFCLEGRSKIKELP